MGDVQKEVVYEHPESQRLAPLRTYDAADADSPKVQGPQILPTENYAALQQETISCPAPSIEMPRAWDGGSSVGCYIQHGPFFAVEDSYLWFKGQYLNGKHAGSWTYYDKAGRIQKTVKY